jgi:predicted alpha/beta hydrolase family esterase
MRVAHGAHFTQWELSAGDMEQLRAVLRCGSRLAEVAPKQAPRNGRRHAKRAVIIPGNGSSAYDVEDKGWYSSVRDQLEADGIDAILCYGKDGHMPSPEEAKREIWVPFVEERMGEDPESCIIIGHSSGAACALRLLEKHKVFGALLVSAYHTHLGDASEKISGFVSERPPSHHSPPDAAWIERMLRVHMEELPPSPHTHRAPCALYQGLTCA